MSQAVLDQEPVFDAEWTTTALRREVDRAAVAEWTPPEPTDEAGRRRTRAAAALVLALSGSVRAPGGDDALRALVDRARRVGPVVGAGRAVEWLDSAPDVLAFAGPELVCALNLGAGVVALPDPGTVLLASSYYGLRDGALLLPPDTVVWWGR